MPILQLELLRPLWSDQILGICYNLFAFFILIAIFVHFNLFNLARVTNLKFPPSPPKLPIIGNLHQLGGQHLHHRFLTLSEKYGPLMLLHLGQAPTLVISSAELVEEMVKNHDTVFSDKPTMTAAKFLLYGRADFSFAPYGEVKKNCVSKLLTNRRVQSFRFAREEAVDLLVNKIRQASLGGRCVNLSEMLPATAHTAASRCIIGHKASDENSNFAQLSKRFLSHFSFFSFGDLFPFLEWLDVLTGLVSSLKATFNEVDEFLSLAIEAQKPSEKDMHEHNQKDSMQILLHLLEKDKDIMQDIEFTQDNLKAILMDLFIGAEETSATTMQWAMAELLKNPKIMKKAQQEVRRVVGRKGKVDEDDINQMEYLKCIVKETLRLHPVAPLMFPRETSSRIKLRGYDILPKTKVLINVWAIHRDPKLWDNPDIFLPERFENNPIDFKVQNFKYIPFGVGRRSCLGISFGVAIVELAVANLLYWFDWKLPHTTDHCGRLDMTEAFGLVAYKKFPLIAVPTIYCP